MARKRVEITISTFRCVKILLSSGATYEEITAMTGVSISTIHRIKYAQTFEEYRQNIRAAAIAASEKGKKKVAEEAQKQLEKQIEKQEAVSSQEGVVKPQTTQSTPMQSNYQMNRLIEVVKEQNEILKVMSNKIAFIVDELTK